MRFNTKYQREILPNTFVDVYDVLAAFHVVDPELQHLVKKALAAGQRGHKDKLQDLIDIQHSISRCIDRHLVWKKEITNDSST